ncbi:hypothetical protein BGZ49_007842 [Haplosporangium sp. Z 27]|nr:hypothetical protein BGZ49_007842 [Haplosporangium sp. Z 27]
MLSLSSVLALASCALYLDGRTRFSRDLKISLPGLKARSWVEGLVANNDISLYNRFEDHCKLRPYAPSLIFEDHTYTWKDLELASNRLAHWYISKGVQAKDRVAMFMTNSPLFVISWLALLKIKAVGVFINNQVTGPVLLHSLKTANSHMLVFDYELIGQLEESVGAIRDLGYSMYTITPEDQVLSRFDEHDKDPSARFFGFMPWRQFSAEGFSRESRRDVEMGDAAALIYTSGTTGFPKAAVMDHGRCTLAPTVWSNVCKITDKDRVYECLPLYHSSGAVIGLGQSWITGSIVVLARKFSTTNFWKDVREKEVTLFQYIGELCRYLLNAPEHPLDKANKVRLVFGNGLRPDVWRKFQERFDIETVFEFYSMSEATTALLNICSGEDGAGAVGFRGPVVRLRIVKVDLDTEELIKDENGYCIECTPGETGELITLADNKTSQTRFVGYYNQPKMSNAKLIQNAFVQGDQYMRTGDLFYRTKDHFYYFADRAGDTFRWKGENVSTAEVADTLGHVDGIASCTVYGVIIPGQDGRAGMAAIVLKDGYWSQDNGATSKDIAAEESQVSGPKLNEKLLEEFVERLGDYANKKLPPYAIPRFIRICEKELEITGTFKNKKIELKKEGFDLTKVYERIYWWSPQGKYLPFGHEENDMIQVGRARL